MARQPRGPGWGNDPTGRHEHRYYDGARWTERVAENGVEDLDSSFEAPPRLARSPESVSQERATFTESPVARARSAYARGDHLYQYSLDVMTQGAVIVAMVGSATTNATTDPSDVVNAVAREGWDLVNASFVFVAEGEQSRDKLLSSGQNVAVHGRTVAYYVFRRCPSNRGGRASDSTSESDEVAARPS
jgi:hypothetical protein